MTNAFAALASFWLLCAPAAFAAPPSALLELLRQAPSAHEPPPPAPAAAPVRTVALDAHRHYTDFQANPFAWDATYPELKTFQSISKDMAEANIETSFLLSDAYWFTKNDAALRYSFNEELSEFITAHPGRFLGFCGIDTVWDDRDAVLKKCLSLPGMVGVKLHFRWHKQTLTLPDQNARFESLLRAADPFHAVFLIHMNFETDENGETEALLAAARAHPGLTFIVAHAAESHHGVLRTLGAAAPENIYTETSTSDIRDPEQVVSSLRAFGIERVLFGVDGPGYGAKRSLDKFLSLALTEAERTAVLETNGRRFLARIAASRSAIAAR